VIAKLWNNINPYLSNKYVKNPVEKSRKIVEKIVDEVNSNNNNSIVDTCNF